MVAEVATNARSSASGAAYQRWPPCGAAAAARSAALLAQLFMQWRSMQQGMLRSVRRVGRKQHSTCILPSSLETQLTADARCASVCRRHGRQGANCDVGAHVSSCLCVAIIGTGIGVHEYAFKLCAACFNSRSAGVQQCGRLTQRRRRRF